jgi:hypothetical protein
MEDKDELSLKSQVIVLPKLDHGPPSFGRLGWKLCGNASYRCSG